MEYEDDPSLPAKLRAERKAGRWALAKGLRQSVVAEGVGLLVQRFGDQIVARADVHFDGPNDRWLAQVLVRCADGKQMLFEEPLLEFPSEVMITQVALVS